MFVLVNNNNYLRVVTMNTYTVHTGVISVPIIGDEFETYKVIGHWILLLRMEEEILNPHHTHTHTHTLVQLTLISNC